MNINPWSGQFTAQLNSLNNRHRSRQINGFIGSLNGLTVLDVGAENYIGKQLGIYHFTRGDLNYEMRSPREPNGKYEIITCFEVIQHLFNQGVLLDNIRGRLIPNGRLYLTTPRPGWFNYYHGKANYCELKPRNLRALLEYKGFHILRERTFRSYPFRFVFYGFLQPLRYFRPFKGDTLFHKGAPKPKWYTFGMRPIVKFVLHKYTLIEAEKI